MAINSVEVELNSSLSASKLFKFFIDFHNIAPKVEPQAYKSFNLIQGDGGVGSLWSVTFGDGSIWKQKLDAIDTNNLTATHTLFEGEGSNGIIETGTHQFKLIPSADGGSVYKYNASFKCKGDAKLDDEAINSIKEATKNTFKAVESYAIDHPEAY